MKKFIYFLTDPGPTSALPPIRRWVAAAALLAARLWLAWPFGAAGWHRVQAWGSQEYLFSQIHPVPLLPASVAAPLTTGAELVLSTMLVLGLAGRIGGAGLGIMAATLFLVIGSTPEGKENGIAVASEQIPWMIIGIGLFILGPGAVSIDMLVSKMKRSPNK